MIRVFLLLLFVLFLPSACFCADPVVGRVKGQVDCSKFTDCLGLVALWSAAGENVPAPDRYVLIPAAVNALEADGRFEVVVPVGEYYAGAQLRNSPGALFGAPRVGDYIYLIKEQDTIGYKVTVKKGEVIDIGTHSDFWVFSTMDAAPKMGVSGRVLDSQQQPVAGLLVFAFGDPGATTNPVAVSSRSGEDGGFVLPLTRPGRVFLRARKNYRGGQPQAEDYITAANGSRAQPVIIESAKMVHEVKVYVRKLPSVLEMKNAPNTARPKID